VKVYIELDSILLHSFRCLSEELIGIDKWQNSGNVVLQETVQGSDYLVVEKVNNPGCNGRHKPVENTKSSDLEFEVPVMKE